MAFRHRSAVARPIVLLTYLASSWSHSGDPCENVALNKRGVFNRETESSGGMLAGSVKKRGISLPQSESRKQPLGARVSISKQ